MFEQFTPPTPDKIIHLMTLFAADPRTDKVDLGVGVYRTPDGKTPVMAAVKDAEYRIWETQDSKSYLSLSGDPAFLGAMHDLVLGDDIPADRVAGCATPGASGAIRQGLELIQRHTPGARIWVSTPTWPNHAAIIAHLGLQSQTYRYYDAQTGGLDRDGMQADLGGVQRGDVVILHACCHNPSGVDLTLQDWADIADILHQKGAIPFIDMAYLGFGDGIGADAAGTRLMVQALPETLLAVSCSKNFGLYRDRVGVIFAITQPGQPRDTAAGILAALNRQSYAFPPDHGTRIVQTILNSPDLRDLWQQELDHMRIRIIQNRQGLVDALRAETGSDRFGFLATHKGMFSLIGASPAQVEHLRQDYGIYMIGDGRMNMAGLTPDATAYVAQALARVLA
jgi:aromatic-amino-acid transaminase